MKNKVLYLGKKIIKPESGADQVNKRNQTLLETYFEVVYLPTVSGKFFKLFLRITDRYLRLIDNMLLNNQFIFVYIEQSQYGRACKHIKKKFPEVKIVMFFHNIEVQYAYEYLKTSGVKALPFYVVIKYWEKISIKYTDYCFTLNERDSKLMDKIYSRKADLVLPTSFPDLYDERKAKDIEKQSAIQPIDYLFVGVSFFANVEAVQWFINEVMPKVSGHFHVVGKGMDKVHFENVTDNIHIHGFVEDISEYYYKARMVVSPVHVGGGMKTKTAEALMYSKTILGSPESFEGYEIDNECMFLCNSAEDYIYYITNFESNNKINNSASRKLFTSLYNNKTLQEKFNLFIQQIL